SSAAGTPTGSVTFFDGAASLGSASLGNVGGSQQASISTSGFSAGVHNLTAKYAATGNFAGSTSAVFPLSVSGVATSVSILSSLSPALFSQSVSFTATVTAASGTPTGSVTFFVDGVAQAPAVPLNGSQQAVFSTSSLTVGTHSVFAKYP